MLSKNSVVNEVGMVCETEQLFFRLFPRTAAESLVDGWRRVLSTQLRLTLV